LFGTGEGINIFSFIKQRNPPEIQYIQEVLHITEASQSADALSRPPE
jgi:hypothetical protein